MSLGASWLAARTASSLTGDVTMFEQEVLASIVEYYCDLVTLCQYCSVPALGFVLFVLIFMLLSG